MTHTSSDDTLIIGLTLLEASLMRALMMVESIMCVFRDFFFFFFFCRSQNRHYFRLLSRHSLFHFLGVCCLIREFLFKDGLVRVSFSTRPLANERDYCRKRWSNSKEKRCSYRWITNCVLLVLAAYR